MISNNKAQIEPPFLECTKGEVLYTEQSLGDSEQCRICLEGQSEEMPLIVVCRCIGSQCLREWMQRKYDKKQRTMACQLCKQQIQYTVQQIKECNSWEKVSEKVRKNILVSIFVIFLSLASFAVTIYLIVILASTNISSGKNVKFIEVGVISFSIALMLLIDVILCSVIYREFLSTRRKVIDKVLTANSGRKFSNITQNSNHQFSGSKARIHPIIITEL